jgi:hypothetical protein
MTGKKDKTRKKKSNMADNVVRLGDLIKVEGLNPMNIDVGYIQDVSHKVPKDGSIDLNEAERLATIFLRCADYCGELISQAVRLVGNKDAERKSKKADAIEGKIAKGTPATTARETYSNDPKYVEATNAHTEAEAFLVWIKQKYENLIKAHVLCKDLLKSHVENRSKSGWEGVDDFDPLSETGKQVGQSSIEKSHDKSSLDSINVEDDFNIDV